MNLKEFAVVYNQPDDVTHVVGLVRTIGDDVVELLVHPQRVVSGLHARRQLEVVLRQEREQVPSVLEALVLVV